MSWTRSRASSTGWKTILLAVKTRIREDRISVSAGSLAYHGFLAFFPAIIAALGVLTLVHVGTGVLHDVVHGLSKSLPAGAAGVFEAAVHAATKRSQGSVIAIVVGSAVALWSATSATGVLQQVLDVVYDAPTARKFMARRIRGMPLLVLTGVLGTIAAVLVVFGKPIEAGIRAAFPFAPSFSVGWTAFRWVLAAASISILFSAYYAFGPNRERTRFRWVTPGSLLATTVFLLGSLGFSYYISTFGSYSKTYGSFAGVAIFIFWLYLTSFAVLIGGELNAELERAGKLRAPSARAPESSAQSSSAQSSSDGPGDGPDAGAEGEADRPPG